MQSIAAKRKRSHKPLSRIELAKALGRNVRTITEYVQRGMPRNRDGSFCLETCELWIKENVKPTGRDGDVRGEEPVASEEQGRAFHEMRKAKADADLREIKVEQALAELIPVEQAARYHERQAATAKALFEQVPDRSLGLLPAGVTGEARQKFYDAMQKMVADVLEALAIAAEEGIEGDIDSDDDESKAA